MLSPLLKNIVTIAEQAGAAIMDIYLQMDVGEITKGDGSPLTQADMAAHHLIVNALSAIGLPVLSEESAHIPFAERQTWSRYFLVDPLDGTKEFLARNGEFTVNIALIDHHQAVLGVVYAPALNLMYVGERGGGSFKRDENGHWQPLQCATPHSPLRVVASRRHGGERLDAVFAALPFTLSNRGSALKICLVAEGQADCYPRFGATSEWDTAAGQAVVENAGGQLLRTDLTPLRYNEKDSVLNPDFMVVGRDANAWLAQLRLSH